MAEPFDEFMEDVEREIRHEQYEKFIKAYGRYILSGVIGIISLAVLWMVYENHQANYLKLISEKFTKAQTFEARGETEKALNLYESLRQKSTPTYEALSQISAARLLSTKGLEKLKTAQEYLLALSKNKKVDVLFSHAAALSYIKNEINLIDSQKINDKNKILQDLLIQIKPLTQHDAPLKLNALETQGLLHILLEKWQEASQDYVVISQTKDCPENLLSRAQIMSQYVLKKISQLKPAVLVQENEKS